ncbi:MAG: hypothetical protein R3A50_01275 [Saprospiraceae bacterium]
MRNNLPILLCIISLAINVNAQDVNKDLHTSSISIFKNGTAFFIKSGKVPAEDKVYRMTEHIPSALFGTFWLSSPSNELNFVSSYIDTLESSEKMLANSIAEMLSANLGQKVKLHIGESEVVEGVVEELGKMEDVRIISPRQSIINLRMDGKWLTLTVQEIRRIEFPEPPNRYYELTKKEIKPVLQVDFNSVKKEQDLDMMYLSSGLSWTPVYLIELIEEQKARLSLRAEVVNNVEDINNTDVNFVVGVPNFNDAKKLSALVDFSASGFHDYPAAADVNRFANSVQVLNSNTYEIEEFAPVSPSGTTDGIDGSAEEDLFFYTLKNMNLKKGGRGHYPVFTANIDIAHIYECNLPGNTESKNYYKDDFLFSPDPTVVYHSIKLINDTKYPFTTGPAMVVKQQGDTKPISQDRLNYTSVKGHSFMKLTEAPDVRINQAEKTIEVKEKAKTIVRGNYTDYYDLFTVEGKIKVENFKNKKIDLNIKRTIMGDLQKSSIKWLTANRINTTGRNSSGYQNNTTDVCWETSIGAGEEMTITYSYKIWVRAF